MDSQLLPFATQDVPRYTSYPTAVQFQSPFPGEVADDWLQVLDREATLSVYVHIPFCRQLCWYCGCHTSVPNGYDRAARYVEFLVRDIRRSAELFNGRRGRVTHLHFGGGTPTYLDDFHIAEIVEATSWASHTTRGFLAGALKKKLGLAIDSEKEEARGRVYRLA